MKKFKKENTIKYQNEIKIYKVVDGELSTTFNPTLQQILEDGWEEYIEEEISIPIEEQYKQRIVDYIRLKYSINDEISLLRQRESKADEFQQYNLYVEECKLIAKQDMDYLNNDK